MRSILEKALIALLNEEKDKADALFHDFILERSRQIHESLRQGEDFVLDESWEQELAVDEMFTEADLDDETDEEVVAEADDESAEEGDEEQSSDDESEESEADADTSAEDNPFGDTGAEEGPDEDLSMEDRVENLEDELTRLAAEFDAMIGGDETAGLEGIDGVDAIDGEVAGDEFGSEFGGDEATVDAGADAAFGGDDSMDDEFDKLGESVLDELESVSVKHAEGMTTDGNQPVDTKPRVKNIAPEKRQAGEPVKIKSDQHKGYERETAPKSDTMKARKNTMKKGDETQASVSKEGDKGALLNTGKEDKGNQHSLFDKKRV